LVSHEADVRRLGRGARRLVAGQPVDLLPGRPQRPRRLREHLRARRVRAARVHHHKVLLDMDG